MFKIYNRSGRVVSVCGQTIPSLESSEPLLDSYYDGEKSRIDRLVRLGVVKKIDMPDIDEEALRLQQQREAEELLRQQQEEVERLEKEAEEMRLAAEKAEAERIKQEEAEKKKAEKEAKKKAEEEAKKKEEKEDKKEETETK